MIGTRERDQWLVQPVCLPVCLPLSPVARVAGETERNFMTTQILRSLIRVTTLSSWRAQQRQAQRLIVRFVRSVFAIGEHSYAV